VYTSDYCGYCRAAKQFLTQAKKVEFEEINLSSNPEERARLAKETGQRTVPMIFVGDTFVGGYNELRALDQAGELDALLES
jgi:glutaredoxin 3